MAKFLSAPGREDTAGSGIEPLAAPGASGPEAWLAEMGVQTGLVGAGVIAAGCGLMLVGLVKTGTVVAHHLLAHQTEGVVIETEPASGGGFAPVVRYEDASGRARRFVATDIAVAEDPTGRRVRVRVIGGSPEVVAPKADPVVAALGAFLPLALGAVAVVTGLTGAVAGVVPVPWP